MSKLAKRYAQLLEKLKSNRAAEDKILTEMDLLWQAMSLEDRSYIDETHVEWPPPTAKIRTQKE